MIDNRSNNINHSTKMAIKFCERHFGIGSDGIIFIEKHLKHAFEMIFYNPDGSKSFCGNGSRCAVNFAKKLGLIDKNCSFVAFDGTHNAEVCDINNEVKIQMKDVVTIQNTSLGTLINTGSPHLVKFVKNLNNQDLMNEAKIIRHNQQFKPIGGVNVNYTEIIDSQTISVRTYERGVENETLSCGTGITACALIANNYGVSSPTKVLTKGGKLRVSYQKANFGFKNIYLIGDAVEVYEGMIHA